MTAVRTPSTAARAVKRRTFDRVLSAIPLGAAVTPREVYRLAGSIGAPQYVNKVLYGLEREGRVIRSGKLTNNGNQIGANLWRRRL